MFESVNMKFSWNGFTRAYFDNFNIDVQVSFQFEPLKYVISVTNRSVSIPKFYQQHVSREEIAKLTGAAKAACLEQIQRHREPQ